MVDRIRQAGGEAAVVQADLAEADAVERLVPEAVRALGPLTLLVNNASEFEPDEIETLTQARWDRHFAVNLRAPLLWVRGAYKAWMGQHGGSIVNVASVAGLRPSGMMGAYNVSKAGLIHLTRQLALELAPKIRVNAIAPAVVRTRLAGALLADEDFAARVHPLGRVGEPEDVAPLIVYLSSDVASWMTGAIIPIDGGVAGASSSGIA